MRPFGAGEAKLARHDRHATVVVAVVAVGVMQVVIDDVVSVVAVGHCRVIAVRAVDVAGLVSAALVSRRAALGVRRVDRQRVLVDVIAVGMVEVAVVEVVDVIVVLDCGVPATGLVLMLVAFVNLVFAHRVSVPEHRPRAKQVRARHVLMQWLTPGMRTIGAEYA